MTTPTLLSLALEHAVQIAVLTTCVAIIARLFLQSRPHLAHTLWLLVLLKCLIPPLWGHPFALFHHAHFPKLAAGPVTTAAGSSSDDSTAASPATPAGTAVTTVDPEVTIWAPLTSETAANTAAVPDGTAVLPATSPRTTHGSASHTQATPLFTWTGLVTGFMILGSLLSALVLFGRCAFCLAAIHRNRRREIEPPLRAHVAELAQQLNVHRVPRVVVSGMRFGPAVLGVLRPVIVIPECLFVVDDQRGGRPPATADPPSWLTMVLAHELMHIRRGDLRSGLLQAIAHCLWWFHPLVWLVNRRLTHTAERCCDEQVIAELNCSPADYARSLLKVIETRTPLRAVPVFPGMKPVEITSRRMERIMSLKHGCRKRTPILCWGVLAALALLVLPGRSRAEIAADGVVSSERADFASGSGYGSSVSTEQARQPQTDGTIVVVYDVSDLAEQLAEDQGQSVPDTMQQLQQIAVRTVSNAAPEPAAAPTPTTRPQPIPDAGPAGSASSDSVEDAASAFSTATIADEQKLVVRGTSAAHTALRQELQHLRKFGVRQVAIEARVISGPAQLISRLVGPWQFVPPGSDAHSVRPAPETILRADEIHFQTNNVAELTGYVQTEVTTTTPLKIRVSSTENVQGILDSLQQAPEMNVMLAPRVIVSNGRQASIHTGTTQLFVVGVENSVPVTRPVKEGILLQVKPVLTASDQLQLHCLFAHDSIASVVTARVAEDPASPPVTVQVPQVISRRIETCVEQSLDECLILGGVSLTQNEAPSADSEELCVVLKVRELTNSNAEDTSLSATQSAPLNPQGATAVSAAAEPGPVPAVAIASRPAGPSRIVVRSNLPDAQNSQQHHNDLTQKSSPNRVRPAASNNAVKNESERTPIEPGATAPAETPVRSATESGTEHTSRKESPRLYRAAGTVSDQADEGSVRVYYVADLVSPAPGTGESESLPGQAGFSQITELIRASVDPESWRNNAEMHEHPATVSLIIRQSAENHDRITALLGELREATGRQLFFTCRIFQFPEETLQTVLESDLRLNDMSGGAAWALLSEDAGAELRNTLHSAGADELMAPGLTTFSGQPASLGTILQPDAADPIHLGLTLKGEILSESGLLRLSHSVAVTDGTERPAQTEQPVAAAPETLGHSTLMRSGQTLLLTRPSSGGASDRTLVLLICPERVREREFTTD